MPSAGVAVDGPLGHVQVDAHAELGGQLGGGLDGGVPAREGGVHAHHAPTAFAQEPLVLGQPPPGAVGTVAIGHAVGAHHPHAHGGAGVGDDVEAAVDGVRALVVVDDGGRAALERLEGTEHGRPADHLEVEGGVEAPPDLLEDLHERRRRPGRRRHPAGQRRVEVVVAADEPGSWWRSLVGARRGPARIGSVVRQPPSRSCRAAATAPAVGTRPISPTPLMP